MDMQPKVFFRAISQFRTYEEREAILFPAGQADLSGIEIDEFQSIEVRFECEIPGSRLSIERCVEEDGEEIIMAGETKIIAKEGDYEDMIVPGRYHIEVETPIGMFESFYLIKPKNYSSEAIKFLRTYLERKVKGLTYQMQKRRSGSFVGFSDQTPPAIILFDKLSAHSKRIMQSLDSINKDPIVDVVKKHKEQAGSRKPDQKSQRWLLGKGSSKNGSNFVPSVVYEKHAKLSYNNLENKWVNFILGCLQVKLRALVIDIDELIRSVGSEIQKLDFRLRDAEEKLLKIKKTPYKNNFKKGESDLKHDVNMILKSKDDAERSVQSFQRKQTEIRRLSTRLYFFQQESWLSEVVNFSIPEKVTTRFLKDRRYAYLYKFYKELNFMAGEDFSIEKSIYPHKRDSLLMEYFAVGLCIDILEEQDFTWQSGWLADSTINPLMTGLRSGEELLFGNSTHHVILAYDSEVDRSHTIDIDKTHNRFVGEHHRRPDIRLSLHSNDGKFINGLIVEVKYRKFRHLWSDLADTNVMAQLKDYKYIKYYDSENDYLSDRDTKVIVLYPKQEGKAVLNKNASNITFIQVEPSDPDGEEKPFGYSELEKKILSFLKGK